MTAVGDARKRHQEAADQSTQEAPGVGLSEEERGLGVLACDISPYGTARWFGEAAVEQIVAARRGRANGKSAGEWLRVAAHFEDRALKAEARVAEVERERLCSQCGELMACMVKVGTSDGWCSTCLDEAADSDLADLRAAVADVLNDHDDDTPCPVDRLRDSISDHAAVLAKRDAERFNEGRLQGVLDAQRRHCKAIAPDLRLLWVLGVAETEPNPYRADERQGGDDD